MEIEMPLLKIHVIEDAYSSAEIDTLLDTVHVAMVESFNVPPRDRYQILTQHPAQHVRALDTGLGFERSAKFILIEVVSRQRTRTEKTSFYNRTCQELHSALGLEPNDLMFAFQINSDEDWSFGAGTAQFLTGQLK
jgi:hypothetical protein